MHYCLWSPALSPVTHLTGLFCASPHTSNDWNWAEPLCQQQLWEAAEMPDACPLQAVRCRRSHATPSSLWKHYTTEASRMSLGPPDPQPVIHLAEMQRYTKQMYNFLMESCRVSTESAVWPSLDPVTPLAPAHRVTFLISLAQLCCYHSLLRRGFGTWDTQVVLCLSQFSHYLTFETVPW